MKNETKTIVDFSGHYFSGRNNVTNTKTIAFFSFFFFNPFDLLILSPWLPPFAFFSSVYTPLSSVTSFILRLKPKRLLAVDRGHLLLLLGLPSFLLSTMSPASSSSPPPLPADSLFGILVAKPYSEESRGS